jgi:hypothetical protein
MQIVNHGAHTLRTKTTVSVTADSRKRYQFPLQLTVSYLTDMNVFSGVGATVIVRSLRLSKRAERGKGRSPKLM